MGTRTAAWRWIGDFIIEVFGSTAISKEDWDSVVAEIARRRATMRGALVVAHGASPTAVQRAALAEALQNTSVPGAILTDSAVVRMGLTALGYFVRGQARPFAMHQLDAAMQFLKIPETLWPQIRHAIAAMETEIAAKDG